MLSAHQAVRLERSFTAFIFQKVHINKKYISLDKIIWSRNEDHRQIHKLKTNFLISKNIFGNFGLIRLQNGLIWTIHDPSEKNL